MNEDNNDHWDDEDDEFGSPDTWAEDKYPEWHALARDADAFGLTFKRGKTATETLTHQAHSINDASDEALLAGQNRGAVAEAARRKAHARLVQINAAKVTVDDIAAALDVGSVFAEVSPGSVQRAIDADTRHPTTAEYLREQLLRLGMWVHYYDARDAELGARGLHV